MTHSAVATSSKGVFPVVYGLYGHMHNCVCTSFTFSFL